jgi:hypothetical protein
MLVKAMIPSLRIDPKPRRMPQCRASRIASTNDPSAAKQAPATRASARAGTRNRFQADELLPEPYRQAPIG